MSLAAALPVASEPNARRRSLSVPGVRLRGVVAATPAAVVDNAAFAERFGEAAVRDVCKMTGVEHRRWAAEGQTTSDLCLAAAERLLERLGWTPDSVDALIFVSQTPDQRLPATACGLHGRLGLAPHCQAFDVGLGCSGYVYGLWLAAALVNAGCRRVLLMAGDTSSRMVDPHDRATAMLFGDAGSASAIEATPAHAPTLFQLGTDGSGAGHLIVPGGGFRGPGAQTRIAASGDPDHLLMDGGEVFGFTLRAVPAMVRAVLEDAELGLDALDALVLHQANSFMLRHIVKKLGLPPERAPINIDRFGNTSSASIPLVMATDLAERLVARGGRVLMAGFGVGYSWGAALMELAPLDCAELLVA
jgi:3-oxoacyl-[acyl-carrier-protein] synthase III